MRVAGRNGIGRWLIGLCVALSALVAAVAPASAVTTVRDAEIEQVLRDYTDPILIAAGLNPGDVDIVLIQDPSINAFVTNSRSMFIHTGLIMAAASPNELKGVIAHETGHMAGGHVARSGEAIDRAMRPAYLSIGLGILAIAAGAPDAGIALIAGSQQFAMSSFVRHTQAQESQADQAAVTYMEASGQSAEGLLTFADRQFRYNEMRSANRIPAWMRTHPLWSDRIQALRARVETAEFRTQPENEADVRALKLIQAKLYGYVEHAARTYEKYPDSDTSDPARYARAVAAMRSSEFDRADREAAALVAGSPKNPYYEELTGEIMYSSGRIEQSIVHHRRALALAPQHPLFQVNLARSLLAVTGTAHLQESIDLLQDASRTEPDNASTWSLMAQAHDRLGNEGLARLASAELRFAIGDLAGARNFAERAQERLARNSPSWRRASDISVIAASQLAQRS
jgi:predicted Zn-dependent protease